MLKLRQVTELEKAADEFFLDNGECSKNNHIFDCSCSAESFIAGATWAFQNREVERVLIPACKYILSGKEIVTTGYRHDQAVSAGDYRFWHGNYNYWEPVPENEFGEYVGHTRFRDTEVQGFLTTKNRFVDRKEAAVLAYSAGQISEPKEELYSEDLY